MDYKNKYFKIYKDFHEKDSFSKASSVNKLIKSNPIFSFDSILDFACGSGLVLLEVLEEYDFEKAYGIDISSDAISRAKSNDKKNKVNWMVGEIKHALNYKAELILLMDIVEHVEDDFSLLEDMGKLGDYLVIKVPIENNIVNSVVNILSLGLIDLNKTNLKKYGHVQAYSRRKFLELLAGLEYDVVDCEYIHLPKRSKIGWEILRIILFPIWFISRGAYINLNGGFMVVLIDTNI